MSLAFVGASTIAGQSVAGAGRARAGSDVARAASGGADRAASFAGADRIERSGTDSMVGQSGPAVSGQKGFKSLQMAEAVRCAAPGGQRQTVN